MNKVNQELIKLIEQSFPANLHISRFESETEIAYGFINLATAKLVGPVPYFVFDIDKFQFKYVETDFFEQDINTLIGHLVRSSYSPMAVSQVVSEFLLRKHEYEAILETIKSCNGLEIFDSLDILQRDLKKIYKEDKFNPEVLRTQVSEGFTDINTMLNKMKEHQQNQMQQEEEMEEEEYKPDIYNIFDIISFLSNVLIFVVLAYSSLIIQSRFMSALSIIAMMITSTRMFWMLMDFIRSYKERHSSSSKNSK